MLLCSMKSFAAMQLICAHSWHFAGMIAGGGSLEPLGGPLPTTGFWLPPLSGDSCCWVGVWVCMCFLQIFRKKMVCWEPGLAVFLAIGMKIWMNCPWPKENSCPSKKNDIWVGSIYIGESIMYLPPLIPANTTQMTTIPICESFDETKTKL